MATITRTRDLGAAGAAAKAVSALLATDRDYGALAARVALGLVILPHGLQKTVGWFGGFGLEGTLGFFTQQLHIPALLALLAIAAESLGALALIAGLGGRVAALGIGVTMATAALMLHLPNGFFMNWFGAQKGEGVEYFILAIGLALAVVIRGSGAWSLDRAIVRRIAE
ncbi:MAG: DoxX family protein [Candidatus Sericytochromatia bacterium]|nr:DoxX family protein [Candidatus Tanganyikabacteria bacterium]